MGTNMPPDKHRIFVLGASGMLGHAVLRYFAESTGHEVVGTVRSSGAGQLLPVELRDRLIVGVDVENGDALVRALADARPTVVINCVGLVKQLGSAKDPLAAVPLNTQLPHRLARLCELANARLVHLSTDCVFSGAAGMYREEDLPDARDVYGLSKLMGEVDYPHAITLRTSIIGHELDGARSLINWFLSQQASVRGFTRAIFSGLPTVEIARVIDEYVLGRPELHGLYHLSVDPIDKARLLELVAKIYGKTIEIIPDESLVIDRSLDSSRFRDATGFQPKSWPELVSLMKAFG